MQNTIVFLHGSGDSARIWRLQTDYFGPARAIALDLPGHGLRPDSLPEEVTVRDYAHVAYEIITQELHIARPIIAGHSLGGAIALTMGLDYGTELSGLILIGTGARLRVHPRLLEEARQPAGPGPLEISALAVAPSHVSTLPQTLLQEHISAGSSMLYRDLSACNIFDVMPQLANIILPTLIICGTDDRLTPPKYSEYLHQQLAFSTLRVIPDAGHYVMREQPEAVNAAIEEWMKKTL